MTTTIALETDKGNFELAIALGIILLTISFAITVALRFFSKAGAGWDCGELMGPGPGEPSFRGNSTPSVKVPNPWGSPWRSTLR